jgi:hypothetical protein
MNDSDIQLITSLVGGRLSPGEQEEGMARMEASPQLRAAYDEQLSVATALRAELHIEEAAAAPAVAGASGWNRWWVPLTGLATAAVIIIAVVVAPNVLDDDGSTGVASAPSAMTTTPTLASDPLAGAAEDTVASEGGEEQATASERGEEQAAAPSTTAGAAAELAAPDTFSFSLKAVPDAPANLELPVLGDDVDVAGVESATRSATEQATVDYAAISRCFGAAGEATGEAVIVGSVTQSGDEVVAVVTIAATGEVIVLTINLVTCEVTSAG